MIGARLANLIVTPYQARVILVSAVYFTAIGISIGLSREVSEVAAIWTANAFLLGVLLRSRPGRYFGYVGGCMVANFLAHWYFDNAVFLTLGFVVCNLAEVLVAFILLRRVMPTGWSFFTSRHVLLFGVVAGLIAPAVGGSLGGLLLTMALDVNFLDAFRAWYLADAMGLLLVVPTILTWNKTAVLRTIKGRGGEAVFIAVMVVGVTLFAIAQPYFAMLYLVSPFLLWAAFRLNTFLTAAASVTVCALTIAATACGEGPLTLMETETVAQRLQFQLFLAVAVLIPLAVAMICEERERLIDELEQKNAELERYAYTISHDLKSPVITIQGFLEHLRQDMKHGNAKHVEEDISQIETATETMNELLKGLLELSRLGVVGNNSERFSLAEVARKALDALPNSVDTTLRIAPGLPLIQGDSARLAVVIRNILDNARKYAQPDVPVSIAIRMLQCGGFVKCQISDNGIGVPAEHLERVFDLFEKLNPESQGSGVGLAIIRRTVEAHGGKVWIESPGINQGTSVVFTLPVVGGTATTRTQRGGRSYVLHTAR